jgi:hypothetical protein
MYASRSGCVEDLAGEIDALGLEIPSICCVKSSSKFVVSSEPRFGVLRLRGVGEGDRDDDDRRLREVEGVGATSRPGVRAMSPRRVGLWPSFAKMVISGISENVLKQVSSMLVASGPNIVDARKSRPAWNSEGVLLGVGSARSYELPRVRGRGVVLSPLRFACRGVFLGVLLVALLGVLLVGVLCAGGVGGGMRSESVLPLLFSMPFSDRGGDLTDLTDPGVVIFLGEMLILFGVPWLCGSFSLSSKKSVKSMYEAFSGEYDFCGIATFSSITSSAMSPRDGLCCLLGLLLPASISLWKGDEGGPSTLKVLSSIGLLICIDGDSIVWGGGCCVVVVSGRAHQRNSLVFRSLIG